MARKSERLHTMLGMYQCNSWLILVITESTAIIRNHMAKTGELCIENSQSITQGDKWIRMEIVCEPDRNRPTGQMGTLKWLSHSIFTLCFGVQGSEIHFPTTIHVVLHWQ